MATRDGGKPSDDGAPAELTTPVDEFLLRAVERGDDSLYTGRFIVTFKARRRPPRPVW